MHNRARLFESSGPARTSLALLLAASLTSLSACASLPHWGTRAPSGLDDVTFLSVALEADGPAREALWRSAAAGGTSVDQELRIALLRSVPGHSGYDPVAAREALARLASQPGIDPEIAAVARLRVVHVDQDAAMAAEVAQLKQRLARIAEIEKHQTGKENGR